MSRVCPTPPPRNQFEVWEDTNIYSGIRDSVLTRWAIELTLPVPIANEVVAEIQSRSNGTEMGEAA